MARTSVPIPPWECGYELQTHKEGSPVLPIFYIVCLARASLIPSFISKLLSSTSFESLTDPGETSATKYGACSAGVPVYGGRQICNSAKQRAVAHLLVSSADVGAGCLHLSPHVLLSFVSHFPHL